MTLEWQEVKHAMLQTLITNPMPQQFHHHAKTIAVYTSVCL